MTKVSIIIPTYNRPNCLKRILNYYDSFREGEENRFSSSPFAVARERKDDFEFIVADSSSNENKKINREIIASLENFKVLYLGDYLENINPWCKFADAVSYAKSEFCLFCSDDDFVIPKNAIFCADFLKNNPNFTAAHGRYILFCLKKEKGGEKKIYWTSGYALESMTNPKAELRLKEHLSDYVLATFSAVHRTSFLKMALEETAKWAPDNRFGELLASMLALIYGKLKCFNLPYAVQEINTNSTGTTTKTLEDFIREGSYGDKYTNFRKCLAKHLGKNSELSQENSEKIIDEAMAAYLKKNYSVNLKSSLVGQMKNVVKFLSPTVYEKIRSIYVRRKFSKPKDNLSVLIDNPSFEYHDVFKKIRDYVIHQP